MQRIAPWLLLLSATGIPLSLLWDYSWECTVGIDRVWAPAHTMTYLAIASAGLAALFLVSGLLPARAESSAGVRLGRFDAPVGAWVVIWGALAFLAALLFDRWWQTAYGLGAGIWHPPQIAKAIAFFAVLFGVWLCCANRQNQAASRPTATTEFAFVAAGGLVLVLISVVTMVSSYPNRQHSEWFYEVACATYPFVLVALAAGGKIRFSATLGSLIYLALVALMVWLLPLFPARPLTAPVYNALDHMMPPPFPLLLVLPAIAVDGLVLHCPWPIHPFSSWLKAAAVGIVFFAIFTAAQWWFAEFLLTDASANWFFAGGGQHWPFFLKMPIPARRSFWVTPQTELNETSALIAVTWAIVSARAGLWVGAWMKGLNR